MLRVNEWVILKDDEIVERNKDVKTILEIAETKYKDIDIIISANFKPKNMKNNNWKISNVFNYNRYEANFEIDELVKITITDIDGNYGESFWIKIIEATGEMETKTFPNGFTREGCGNTHFKGEVFNDLTILIYPKIGKVYPKIGEVIEFNIGNIIKRF